MINEISYGSVSLLLILIIPIILINRKIKLDFNKRMIIAIVRMTIQLSLVGVFLQFVFKLDHPLLNYLYLLMMILVASITTMKSGRLKIKGFMLPIFLAFMIPNTLILLYFNYFVAQLDNVFSAQILIPIGGMLLGNTLNGSILCINNFYTTLKSNSKEYYYALSLSGSRFEALAPYFRSAVFSSVNLTLASMETIGLVALPGMMTGQILGGSIPITAIKYQLAIMLAILIARYFSAILSLIFTIFKAFDDYDRLTI